MLLNLKTIFNAALTITTILSLAPQIYEFLRGNVVVVPHTLTSHIII